MNEDDYFYHKLICVLVQYEKYIYITYDVDHIQLPAKYFVHWNFSITWEMSRSMAPVDLYLLSSNEITTISALHAISHTTLFHSVKILVWRCRQREINIESQKHELQLEKAVYNM